MARVCVFDVNETLIDLSALDPHFESIFGAAAARRAWFAQALQSAMAATLSGFYADFGIIARAALQMVAARQNLALTEEHVQQIMGAVRLLPLHPDVRENLERLRAAGLRIVALTNSPPAVVTAQLAHAGVSDLFEQVLSVDAVRRFKPAPEVYQMAAAQLGVAVGGLRMIAAHDWDVSGAMRAGCAGAFVARPGMVLDPLAERPDVVGSDLYEVTDQILAIEQV
ncbi:MAG: haloacid dehalogenase type II [Chloroflexales bacterium]|nr:haloacid dehalogenase type II [Chloroflexales bacterium]